MNRRLYIAYVMVVLAIVFIVGSQEQDDRSWGQSSGRSGWSSGMGHK